MGTYKCLYSNTKRVRHAFLSLPAKLYKNEQCPQDYKTEKSILQGTHTLSKAFTIYPFVVLDEFGKTCCRCLLTYYPNDPVAYVGFFEATKNKTAVKEMFLFVERKARKDGKNKIIGPVNASIYIGYRFKVNQFSSTYTGEPYNKSYYKEMWEQSGFIVDAKYISNKLRKVSKTDIDPRLEKVYNRYIDKGFSFISPTHDTFIKCLKDVYKVMMESYSGFVGFKEISESQFVELFSNLKFIADYNMIKLAYKDDNLHAFAITLPNYKGLTNGKLTLSKIIKIKKIQKNPSEYVILYVGADNTIGLGSALLHHLRDLLYENQCTAITALIKDGNLTGKLYSDLYTNQFEYVLLSKEL